MKLLSRGSRARVALIFAVVGPGFITATVDNDAGGIFTYSLAGAQFGYSLLWAMIPIAVALVVIQEMAARMAAVTGKGLSDLIREEFGFRLTFFVMLALVVTNFGNVVAEFAGVATSVELFGASRHIVVPLAAFIVWVLVVRGTYDSIEKIFLAASAFYVCYIVAGLLASPDWKAAAFATVTRPSASGMRTYGYVYMVIALVGTTIAPWMQFYLQASIVEKGVTLRQCRRRLVHHRRVRGDAVHDRPAYDRRCWRCGGRPATAGRRVRVYPVRGRLVQRVVVRRVHPANLDRVYGV
jgi:NRAMP (natural resistance-associated macrophage protein)-like metal ion transporter